MSDCLWNDISAKWIALLTAEMGQASAYATLKLPVNGVEQGEVLDTDHIAAFPYCMFRSLEMTYGGGDNPHGDGQVHYGDIQYPHEFLFVAVAATKEQAEADVKELLRRMRQVIRNHISLDSIQSSDGETVWLVEPSPARVEVNGIGGTNQGEYLASAVFELTVFSEV